VKLWAQRPLGDRSHCVELAQLAPEQTYAALLTCLDESREARTAKKERIGQR
jgi:hypothetical protein